MRKHTVSLRVDSWVGFFFGKKRLATAFSPSFELRAAGFQKATHIKVSTKPGDHDFVVRSIVKSSRYKSYIVSIVSVTQNRVEMCNEGMKEVFGWVPKRLFVTVTKGRKKS